MKRLFSRVEAQEFLGLSESAMRNEVGYRKSIVPIIKGKHRIFSLEQLEDWKANGNFTSKTVRDDLLTLPEAAELLGVNESAFRDYCDEHDVPAEMVNGNVMLFITSDVEAMKDDVIRFIAGRLAPPPPRIPLHMMIPVEVDTAVRQRLERDGGFMYRLVRQLWADWLVGKRMVFPGDKKEFGRQTKTDLFVRVPEDEVTAVKIKCKEQNMSLAYATAALLDRWSRG